MFLCLRCCDIVSCLDKKRQLVNLIRERQARQIGHVMCGDTLLEHILEGRMKGKQQIAKPRLKL